MTYSIYVGCVFFWWERTIGLVLSVVLSGLRVRERLLLGSYVSQRAPPFLEARFRYGHAPDGSAGLL